MSGEYLRFTKKQFEEDILKSDKFKIINNKASWEYIYEKEIDKYKSIRIFSSIDKRTDKSRDNGKDAIRFIVWDKLNGVPLSKTGRTNRSGTIDKLAKRVIKKINETIEKGKILEVTNYQYIKAILEDNNWSSFASNLLQSLSERGSLTGKQLEYVLGEVNPRGKMTFEACSLKNNPLFKKLFLKNNKEIEPIKTMDSVKQEIDKLEKFDKELLNEVTPKKEIKLIQEKQKEETCKNIELVETSEYLHYDYPFAFFNPVQSEVCKYINEDKNMVIGANTSAGKTICAELLMDRILSAGKRIVYLSPLKSLTEEKYEDWQVRFKKYNICIMTGDYSLSEKKKQELESANIIVLTSEMMDSRTRKVRYEDNTWIHQVGLVVVDECFPGSTKVRVSENYEVPIKDIVENDSFKYVLSYNEKTKVIEKKKILRKMKNENKGNLVRITYKDINNKKQSLVCTANHKIWTSNGYKIAETLTKNDSIKSLPVSNKNYCEICNKQWSDESGGFNHHYYLQHIVENDKFKCDACGRLFKRIEDFKNHKCSVSLRSKGICHICKNKFNSIKQLKEHYIKIHNTPYLYFCKECKKGFEKKSDLFSHTVKEHRNDTFWKNKEAKRKKSIDWEKFGKSISNSPLHQKAMKELGKKRTGKNNPIYLHNGRGLKKIKKIGKERWESLSEEKKQEQIKRFINAPKYLKNKKTSIEIKVNEYGFNNLYYTGDGSFFLTFKNGKKKNPDFKIKGQRKVIEVGDFEYWHNWDEANEVINQYNNIGYKCLYLTADEINKEWSNTINKIETFIQNHDYKVIEVKKYGNSKIKYVYNIEVEDNHNYIANNILVSNCHILSTGRGHAVESGLMRFSAINRKSSILLLSATMPNVDELGDWLTVLNGKDTNVIYNTWRPVELQIRYHEFEVAYSQYNRIDYWGTQTNKKNLAIDCIMEKPDEKFLVFVHDKNTGKALIKLLILEGEKAEFHSADISLDKRKEIEKSFKNRKDGLRIMVSTSSTAWGVNLPARNVVIVGTTRGIQEVDELDIIQMSGRAGRYGIDDQGFVNIIVEKGSTNRWKNIFTNPRPVLSVLNNKHVLAFHTLAEMQNKVVNSPETLLKWYNKSLAYLQEKNEKYNRIPFDVDDAEILISDLGRMNMIIEHDKIIKHTTGLGKTSAYLYFSPYDINSWYNNFKLYFKINTSNDKLLSWAIGNIPTKDIGYIPKDITKEVNNFKMEILKYGIRSIEAPASVLSTYQALTGNYGKEFPTINIGIRGIRYDIERTVQALKMIDATYADWKSNIWDSLPQRVKYGIPEEMIELTTLPKIGGVRARKLWENGIRSIKDVANNSNTEKLIKAIPNPALVSSMQSFAKKQIKWQKGIK